MAEIESVEGSEEEGTYVVKLSNGYQAVIEDYNDAEGWFVAAGNEYLSEENIRELEDMEL